MLGKHIKHAFVGLQKFFAFSECENHHIDAECDKCQNACPCKSKIPLLNRHIHHHKESVKQPMQENRHGNDTNRVKRLLFACEFLVEMHESIIISHRHSKEEMCRH